MILKNVNINGRSPSVTFVLHLNNYFVLFDCDTTDKNNNHNKRVAVQKTLT